MTLVTVIAPLVTSLAAWAQAPAADRLLLVRQIHVKPEMMHEWTELVKNEVLPALKKAGIKSVNASETVLGAGYEFQFAVPIDSMAALDGPGPFERALGKEGEARLMAKLNKCTVSTRSYVATVVGALSNPRPATKPAPYTVYVRYRVYGGKTAEHEQYIKNEVLPQYKKAGLNMTYVRRGLGASSAGEVSILLPMESLGDIGLTPPIRRAMGEDAYLKMSAKGTALRTNVESTVRRRRADLGYTQ